MRGALLAAALACFLASPSWAEICPAARKAESYKGKDASARFLYRGHGNWLFSSRDFKSGFTAPRATVEGFRRIAGLLRHRGQALVIFVPPPRGMAGIRHAVKTPEGYDADKTRRSYKEFLRQLEEAGAIAVGVPDVPGDVGFYHPADIHWSAAGADLAAQKVAEAIRRLPFYDSLEKADFETEVTGKLPPEAGGYAGALLRICGTEIPPPEEKTWATHRKGSLLDDSAFPSIAVVGTSFVAIERRFNFTGALKRHLRADVYNAAISGGGFDEAAVAYFSSPAWRDHPPKAVVWEIQPGHHYESEEAATALRQIAGAISGCSRSGPSESGRLGMGATEILTSVQGRVLKNAVLYVEAEEAEFQVLYADGSADRMEPDKGRFLEITARRPLFFRLMPRKPGGKFTARICGE